MSASSPHAPLPQVFVIGDSISIQYGPYLEQYLQHRFGYDRKRMPPGSADPDGANGGDSAMVRAYLQERLRGGGLAAGTWLLCNCGLHDIKTDPVTGERQVAPERYRENLGVLLDLAAGSGLRPVWVRITPVFEDIHNARNSSFHRFGRDVAVYNRIADEIMAARAVPVIDLHAFTLPLLPAGFIDHVHFSDEIRRLQAAFIAGTLLGLGRSPVGREVR
ncbi:MAG: SGNH/GDSL hydrolase family protein [Opitutaceae bacterium]|nr:SGNH/GDSL hydrolase family protein [Opitutaceae bacterium]